MSRHERQCRHAPRRFAFATAAMAACGYLAIVAALGASLACIAYSIDALLQSRPRFWMLMLLAAALSLAWSLVHALRQRDDELPGIAIERAQAPALFELIDRLRRSIGAPRIHTLRIDRELNAALIQQPRLGLLGWHRNHLVLGLPLMMGLGTQQLAAVVAHELGHLRGAHGRVGGWIYRTRRSWARLVASRERAPVAAGWADVALAAFCALFFPRFNARALVLARRQEYEADRIAHRAVGAREMACGLIAMHVQERYLEDCFWPEIHAATLQTPTPRASPLAAMRGALGRALEHPRADAWLRDALKRLPEVDDTHPSLRERVELADVVASLPVPSRPSAAGALLEPALKDLIEALDRQWREDVAPWWSRRHRDLLADAREVEQLGREHRQAGRLAPDDHFLWAWLVGRLRGDEAALALLRAAVAEHPGDAGLCSALGHALLDAGTTDDALELLRWVANGPLTEDSLAAARRVEATLEDHAPAADLAAWRERLRAVEREFEGAWRALHEFAGEPLRLAPAACAAGVQRRLLALLRRHPAVGRAWLVRRVHPAAPQLRYWLLVVERSKAARQPDPHRWWSELKAAVELPCPFMVIDLAHPHWADRAQQPTVAQLTAAPAGCVYTRRDRGLPVL